MLYTFEVAYHPTFVKTWLRGEARLLASELQNQPFFRAIHLHAVSLSNRGCPNAALGMFRSRTVPGPTGDLKAAQQSPPNETDAESNFPQTSAKFQSASSKAKQVSCELRDASYELLAATDKL